MTNEPRDKGRGTSDETSNDVNYSGVSWARVRQRGRQGLLWGCTGKQCKRRDFEQLARRIMHGACDGKVDGEIPAWNEGQAGNSR